MSESSTVTAEGGLLEDERQLIRIKARGSGMDSVILYVERLLARVQSDAERRGLATAMRLVNDVRRVQQEASGWSERVAGLSDAFDEIATEIAMRDLDVTRPTPSEPTP